MPELVLVFSGKRKSGKDYICERLKNKLGASSCNIIRISGPLKGLYAQQHNLNLYELMGDGPYKEKYRHDMIVWSDNVRSKDPGYFCKAACSLANETKIWIISDVRRKTDVAWFKENYSEKLRLIRVSADEEVRKNRGWVFTEGVDDVDSECNLDGFQAWDLIVLNNNDEELETGFNKILDLIE